MKPAPRWSLGRPAFDRLLAWLDPQPHRTAEAYETARRRLARFFEWRGCRFPEELTDETFDRVARRLEEGIAVESPNPLQYLYGVARLVCLEALKRQRRDAEREPELARWLAARAGDPDEAGARHACLEGCLQALPDTARELLVTYYDDRGRDRIAGRQRLARELGIPVNALRIRVYRLREQLGSCLRRCLGAKRSVGETQE